MSTQKSPLQEYAAIPYGWLRPVCALVIISAFVLGSALAWPVFEQAARPGHGLFADTASTVATCFMAVIMVCIAGLVVCFAHAANRGAFGTTWPFAPLVEWWQKNIGYYVLVIWADHAATDGEPVWWAIYEGKNHQNKRRGNMRAMTNPQRLCAGYKSLGTSLGYEIHIPLGGCFAEACIHVSQGMCQFWHITRWNIGSDVADTMVYLEDSRASGLSAGCWVSLPDLVRVLHLARHWEDFREQCWKVQGDLERARFGEKEVQKNLQQAYRDAATGNHKAAEFLRHLETVFFQIRSTSRLKDTLEALRLQKFLLPILQAEGCSLDHITDDPTTYADLEALIARNLEREERKERDKKERKARRALPPQQQETRPST